MTFDIRNDIGIHKKNCKTLDGLEEINLSCVLEPFFPIPNLPHLCGEFSTKNQLFQTGNEDSRPYLGVNHLWGRHGGANLS